MSAFCPGLSRGASSLGLAAGTLHLPSPLCFLRDDAFDNIVNLEVKWGQGMAQLTQIFIKTKFRGGAKCDFVINGKFCPKV